MAILHGSWILQPSPSSVSPNGEKAPEATAGYFFLWGEAWQRVEPIGQGNSQNALPHPYAMSARDLIDWLRSLHQSRQLTWAVTDIPLEQPVATVKSARGRRQATATPESSTVLEQNSERWVAISCTIPTHQFTHADRETVAFLPQHSAAYLHLSAGKPNSSEQSGPAGTSDVHLHPWQIQGIALTPLEVLQLLNSLPLSSVNPEESFLGGDLRFWSHVARWTLDLLARSKFLPSLLPLDERTAVGHWQALVDSSIDQTRLQQYMKRMPPVCQMYRHGQVSEIPGLAHVSGHTFTRTLIFSFLHHMVDAQVRSLASGQPLPPTQFPKDIPLREWLQSLGNHHRIQVEPERLDRLHDAALSWVAPLQRQLSQQMIEFRTCFVLTPPTSQGTTDWTLEFCLQATDDPELRVDAATIWSSPVDRLKYQGRTIEQPQETLLAGLGLASRLYPLLETSLNVKQPEACPLNPGQVYEFIRSTAWWLQDNGFGVVLPPSLSQQGGVANRLGLSIRAEAPGKSGKGQLGLKGLLNFKWELTIGGQTISRKEFDRLVAQNTPLVEINGEWVEFRPQDIKAAQSFFDSRKDEMSLSLEDAIRISTGDTQMIDRLPVINFEASGALQELIQTLTTGNQTLEAIVIPKGLKGELRPYQVRGVSWLAFLQQWGLGACLADDMGLGKTVQFIAFLLHLQEQKALERPTLLVCPTSVLGNWQREVRRFGPSLKVLVHHGDKRSQGKAFAKAVKDKHLVITSYALVYRDEKTLKGVDWQGVVLDEAQNIKNVESKQSQAVRQLHSDFRIALTGTPVENRLTELWSIMDFLNPGYLGPRNFFQRRFAIPIERYGDTDSLKTLRSLVQPFILRRLKTDRSIIQDLPEKQEMTIFCGLSADQATIYQSLVEDSLAEIESAEGIQRKGMILALLTRLKQVCNHPVLLQKSDTEDTNDSAPVSPTSPGQFQTQSGKVQRLAEMLEEVLSEGDRCLIFTQFSTWGKLLKQYLEQHFSREVLFLYGSTSQKQREEMIARFQNDPQGPRIFILSLKAGGVGLNLTRANHVFHFDRWWNPAVENQATDRVFRIGQTRNVQVHKFVCTGTLEERIHELIESKKALSEQVVGTGENWLTELDSDQLRNLLLLDRSAVMDES
jgi:superfamily II DNA or RNA helicase